MEAWAAREASDKYNQLKVHNQLLQKQNKDLIEQIQK